MKKFKEIYEPYMKRPMIYMTFTRFVLALAVILLADFFLSPVIGRPAKATLFPLAAFLFAAFAWIARLRLDGMKLPQIMMLRIDLRKKPSRMYGDMIDYVDERPEIDFADLDDNEKDLCILCADLFCFVVFLIISFFV